MKFSPRKFQQYFCILNLAVVFSACDTKNSKVSLPQETPAKVETMSTETQPEKVTNNPAASLLQSTASVALSNPAEPQELRVSGQIVSAKQGQASFKVAGHIAKINVQIGEKVSQGAVLAKLDDTDYSYRARLAKNSVELATIALNQARRDAEREEQLKKENATTSANIERQNNTLLSAQIQFSQAQINYQLAQKSLNDTNLTASFNGVVSKRLKVEGEYVAVGNAVFEVSALNDFEVSLRVPESAIGRVKLSETVKLNIPSSSSKVSMKIVRIVPVIQEQSRTFEVIGKIEESKSESDEIFPGQFVEAIFQ
jgi:RND family efflux transporter MFP subunit